MSSNLRTTECKKCHAVLPKGEVFENDCVECFYDKEGNIWFAVDKSINLKED